ncbi:MAG: elongation factor P [Sedimentisphaerales bacterium]|nr:elongation factor P [Sedimentisphaerales bacterium]
MRPGMAVTMDGSLFICTQATHVTPGNLRAFVQAKLKRISDGVILEKRLRSTEEVDEAYLDKRQMEYLYSDNTGHILMDTQTFEQITLSNELMGDLMHYFKPNTVLTALLHEGKVVSIELPKAVELTITDTTPMMKTATVTNQMKDAVCETGLKIRVPPFINVGDVVRINTENGEYVGRVNK